MQNFEKRDWLLGLREYNLWQLTELKQVIDDIDLTSEQINLLANPDYTPVQMQVIVKGIRANFSMHQISLFSDKLLNAQQMDEIFKGIKNKLPEEKIRMYAKKEIDARNMEEIRLKFEKEEKEK